MEQLRHINLEGNNLSGTVPLELGTLPNLPYINLQPNCNLTGCLTRSPTAPADSQVMSDQVTSDGATLEEATTGGNGQIGVEDCP